MTRHFVTAEIVNQAAAGIDAGRLVDQVTADLIPAITQQFPEAPYAQRVRAAEDAVTMAYTIIDNR